MRRGTTPTHEFIVDLDLREATEIFITYKQGCKRVVEKTLTDVIDLEEDKLSVKLTQEETLSFMSSDDDVSVQIRAKFLDESAVASNEIKIPVNRILKDGKI